VPSGARWLHEIKFDGYRVQLHIANEDINVFTRPGNDWTKRFKKIAADAYPTTTRRSRLLFFALEQASRYGIGAMKEAGGIKWLRATRAL